MFVRSCVGVLFDHNLLIALSVTVGIAGAKIAINFVLDHLSAVEDCLFANAFINSRQCVVLDVEFDCC